MNGTVLDKIIAAKRVRIDEAKRRFPTEQLAKNAAARGFTRERGQFRKAISRPDRINIIAEFKRASPSRGLISDQFAPGEIARMYQQAGAAAISVLTEEDFFRGSLEDLCEVQESVQVPVLRKDFIIDEYQILESAVAAVNAILLIAAALDPIELKHFHDIGSDYGLDVLVEVHDTRELDIALDAGAELIGINNRNLKTFNVSLEVSESLVTAVPEGKVVVAESGIKGPEDIIRLREAGFSAFLVGETLMSSAEPLRELQRLLGADISEWELSCQQQ